MAAGLTLWLGFAAPARAQIGVYYNNSVSSGSGSATISSFTVPSVPAGDSYFVVGISCFATLNSSAPYCSGSTPLTWGGSATGSWTLIGGASTSNFRAVDMWYLRNPSGTGTIAASTSASKLVVGVVLVGGVNTGGPSSAFGTFVSANGSSNAPTAPAATTVIGDLVVSAAGVYQTLCGSNSPPTGCTPGSTPAQTEQWELYSSTSSSNVAGLGSTAIATATGTTMSWTASSSNNWSIGAVPLHAATHARHSQVIIGKAQPPNPRPSGRAQAAEAQHNESSGLIYKLCPWRASAARVFGSNRDPEGDSGTVSKAEFALSAQARAETGARASNSVIMVAKQDD